MGNVAAPRIMSQALKGLMMPPVWMAMVRSFFIIFAAGR